MRPDQTRDIKKAFYGRRYNQVQTTFALSITSPVTRATSRRTLQRPTSLRYQLADFKNEGQYAEPTIRKGFQGHDFLAAVSYDRRRR